MANALVASGTFFVHGLNYPITPERQIRFDARLLPVLTALYAIVSMIAVLFTNAKTEKGQEIAGNMVYGFFRKKKNRAMKEQELLPDDSVAQRCAEESNQRIDAVAYTI